jgi:hypothetical protein
VSCGSDRERYARGGIETYGRSGIVNTAATATAAPAASHKCQKRRERDYGESDLNSTAAAPQAK